MLRAISYRKFWEWVTFAELEPFDPERVELSIGTVVQTLRALYRKKGSQPPTLDECVLHFGDSAVEKPKKDWKELFTILSTVTRQMQEEEAKAKAARKRQKKQTALKKVKRNAICR
jgi:hypothetical protein